MKYNIRWALALAAGIAMAPGVSQANVFPSALSQSANSINVNASETVTLSFILNENADTNVIVEVLTGNDVVVKTFNLGPKTAGAQSVVWDGKNDANVTVPSGTYYFKVTASDDGYASWTSFTVNSEGNNYELPRGVAVNKNKDSKYYGRIYVSNPRTNPTVSAKVMGDGIYIVNADFSYITGLTGVRTGGVDWSQEFLPPATNGAVTPFRLQIGPDDNLYITSWSDRQSGLWVADPDVAVATSFFDEAENLGRDANGLTPTHGSTSDVVVIGTGANRAVYTADEDYVFSGAPTTQAGSILKYPIGTANVWPAGQLPTLFYDDAKPVVNANWNINFFNALDVDKDGYFWYSQTRSAGTDNASLVQIDPTTGDIIWRSLTALGSPDPLRGTQSMAYDPVNNVIALVSNRSQTTPFAASGLITIFDVATKSVVTSFGFLASATGSLTNCDVVFDGVGNLYVSNRSAERVRVWSPPTGANSSSTSTKVALGLFAVTPVKVTIDQAVAQADPTSVSPVNFTATFNTAVTGFTGSDVVLGGTAGATTAVVTGGPTVYNIAVSGMTQIGTVTATIPAGVCVDGSSNINAASTSTDNSVSFFIADKVGKAKAKPISTLVALDNVIVTKLATDGIWVQESDRSAGVRVKTTATINVGDVVDVLGVVGLAAPEKFIDATVSGGSVSVVGSGSATPLLSNNKTVGGGKVTGGAGLADDGLLVTVFGKLEATDFVSGSFYVNDGSNVPNDTPTDFVVTQVAGVKCTTDFPPVGVGNYYKVTGIVRLATAGPNTIRVIETISYEEVAP